MTKRETFFLMTMISEYYKNFDINQDKVNAWYEALKSFSLEKAKENLVDFVKESPIPPRICDITMLPMSPLRRIPNAEDTAKFLSTPEALAPEEIIQMELAKMRKLLGLERG
jgi:hypothetical protein